MTRTLIAILALSLFALVCPGCSSPRAHQPNPQFAAGIGALICDNDGIEILQIAEGYPADRAGLKASDRILEVDKLPTKGLSVLQTTVLLRGPAGSSVSIVVQSAGRPEQRQITLIRQTISPSKLKLK